MAKFQVKLAGEFKDYDADEDKILKRAFLAGFPNAKYKLRGQNYEVKFEGLTKGGGKGGSVTQKNLGTGKVREARPPFKWSRPAVPVTKAGPTFCISVPPGSPGTTIQVPHPKLKGQFIAVNVPPGAKVGQAMLVPIPDGEAKPIAAADIQGQFQAPAAPAAEAAPAGKKAGWSTGGKAAAIAGGAVVVGGLAVGGAVLGEHIAEEGWDATMADLGDGLEGAGEGIADGAEAAVDWVGDAADTAGDFIMDLF